MGRRHPRFNEKARQASRPSTALPHPKPRDCFGSTSLDRAPIENQEDQMILDPMQSQKPTTDLILEPKMSSKKRKRLEKFIEKQLKKEERVKLIEKLR